MGASEASYRELFEANPQPMWVCHRETGRMLAVNRAALRLYGYELDEFLDLSLERLGAGAAVEPDAAGNRATRGRQLRRDGSGLDVELSWLSCEFCGARAELALVRPLEEAADKGSWEAALEGRLADCRLQMEAAQRELETFSYSVSHDLQAPLRHINGFSQALKDDYGELLDHQAHEDLTRICQAADKMSQLIEAMQKLSRAARSELNRQGVNLSVAVQVISLELKHATPGRRVEFEIQEGVSAQADPRLARQLLEILIGNAWKFSSKTEQAVIRFGAETVNGETVYSVRDNGAGFDMAYAEKLFSIFHRLHRTDEFEGIGVGLAIAKRIVGRHGGRIWAESAPEQGASFYFTL